MRALFFRTGAGSAPPAAAKGRGQPELHWSRAEKPRGQLDGALHPVPRRGAWWLQLRQILICILHHIFMQQYNTMQTNTKSMNVYCFWTGTNELTENRKRCLEQFKQTCGCNVILVDTTNLSDYILKDQPLHPAYEYLSETHRADYLRTYFMHFYGGGYTDIKETTGSWMNGFNQLENDDNKWICGYPELCNGVAYGPVVDKWRELIGNCAYICKPQTPLTSEWYNEMVALLDSRLERLKRFPATYPADSGSAHEGYQGYPIEWNEMLGRIFHKVSYKYKNHLLNTLPISIFDNYR